MKNLIEQFGETMFVFVVCATIIALFSTILLMVTHVI